MPRASRARRMTTKVCSPCLTRKRPGKTVKPKKITRLHCKNCQVRNPDALRRLACCDPLGDLPLILRHIVGRSKATAISSSAHADPICGGQNYCFLLARLHGLPVDLLKETKQQHAFAPCLESLRHGGLRASLLPSTMCTICGLPWPKGNTDVPTRLRSNKSMLAGNVVGYSHRLPQVGMKLQRIYEHSV
jgi:hypothetical protein